MSQKGVPRLRGIQTHDESLEGLSPATSSEDFPYLDAEFECRHGAHPYYDLNPPCGCWKTPLDDGDPDLPAAA